MSVLDRNLDDNRPPAAERAAHELLQTTKQTFQFMSMAFNRGAEQFWNNGDGAAPQEIADALGADATEIFQLHAKLGQLLAEVKPESITQGLSYVGTIVYNEDGTVQVSK